MKHNILNDSFLLDILELPAKEQKSAGGLGTFQSISIGGLGDIRLKAIRFDTYVSMPVDGQFWLRPVFTPAIREHSDHDVGFSGVELLVSLAELYDAVNRPGRSEKVPSDLVAEWCTSHIHPYNQQAVLDELELERILAKPEYNAVNVPDDDPMKQLLSAVIPVGENGNSYWKPGIRIEDCAAFPLNGFLADLHRLISAFYTYIAISDLKNDDPEAAKGLYYIGKHYDGPALFEHFKAAGTSPWTDDAVMYGFADMFPPLRMEMVYDYDRDCMRLVPFVRSVFDVCWYTLSCVTGLADQVDLGKRRYRFIRCEACGKLITAYYICHFFYRYLARFFPLYIRLDPKWNQIIGYISKDMWRYCDGSRIVKVYDLRTKCEEAISKSVNMKEMVHALITCGYPVWYTDSAWLTLLRQFPTDRKVPRLYCTEKPVS